MGTRLTVVKQKQLCFNCLGKHQISHCKSRKTCRFCNKRHHSDIWSKNTAFRRDPPNSSEAAVFYTEASDTRPDVLLKTAVAEVGFDQFTTSANILFDEGAQRTFITEKLANDLHLPRTGTDVIRVASFGNQYQDIRHMDKADIYLKTDYGKKIKMHVLIVPNIAVPFQNRIQKEAATLPYLQGLRLAHPVTTDDVFEISFLIGADYYWQIVQDRVIRGNGPTAVKSKIGYLLSGPMNHHSTPTHANYIMNVVTAPPTADDIDRFWKLESLGISADANDKAEANAMRDEIIADQEKRSFIEKVPEVELQRDDRQIHYIPHHPVKKDSDTTPVRIVYDCSSHQSKEVPSLNDCLQLTPTALNDLTTLLVRFRLHKFAVSTDIEKAFLHVGLHGSDRDVTRFLWLLDPSDVHSPLQTYRFKAVLFGATCSPFILNATLQKHLQENSQNWASKTTKNDLYVDNIISSFPEEDDLLKYFLHERDLMLSAGFNLRAWTTNSEKLKILAGSENVLDPKQTTKVLGMAWNTPADDIGFLSNPITMTSQSATKREILRQTSRIYDPLGLLTPVTVRAKILIQDTWKHDFTWDTIYQMRHRLFETV
ncbi:uncharacterized protein LOC128555938 [Mercenaria mercenaria]|uniref:uncharacterized protein LOC128555938 n=1 Tax=Mercenaria mercenaria TaxID=6596 RepID=UPI00234FA079|nr:uncharacterized protein LOC128555938 [Mercenaria mercenaria]